MDVQEAASEYLASLKRLRPLTVAGYAQRLDVFCAYCGSQGIALEQVRAKVVDTFVEHLRTSHTSHKAGESISTYTLAGYVRVILAFLHWCLDDEEYSEYVKPVVVKRIKLPRVVEKIIDTFSDQQVEALLHACQREQNEQLRLRDECIIQVLLTTGIRAFELCGLTIAHTNLDPKDTFIRVLGKGQREREIPLDDKPRRLLKKYIRQFRIDAKPHETVFIGRTHRPLTVDGLEKIIYRLGKVAGIEGVRVSPHTFRHTFSVRFMREHANIYQLSRILGHRSVATSEKYIKTLSGADIRASLRKLNGL